MKGFRFGLLAPGKSRIVIDLGRTACPTQVSAKPIVEGEARSAAHDRNEAMRFLRLCGLGPLVRQVDCKRPFDPGAAAQPVIVLDPGHGGVDGGARGLGGVQEKTLVFGFCAELKRQLEATKRYAIVMTRDGDRYVDLDDRVAMARKANASLFISVHADTLSEDKSVSGTTVYTVADRASDAEAARIAARENAAGRASGRRGRLDNPGVADILFDLKRRETRTYAHIFSRGLLDSLKTTTRLNHNPQRSAGFAVLKAPEFPSVLVELGYLSNTQDVQSLSSPEWRGRRQPQWSETIDAFFAGDEKPDESISRKWRRLVGCAGSGAIAH